MDVPGIDLSDILDIPVIRRNGPEGLLHCMLILKKGKKQFEWN